MSPDNGWRGKYVGSWDYGKFARAGESEVILSAVIFFLGNKLRLSKLSETNIKGFADFGSRYKGKTSESQEFPIEFNG